MSIEVQFHHRPGMHDESFECAGEAEALAVLAEEGVTATAPIPDGEHYDLEGGGFAVVLRR